MKKIIKFLTGMVCCFIILGMGITAYASQTKEHGRGLTDDKEFLDSLPEIVDVRFNEQAVENLKSNNIDGIQAVETGDEIITDQDAVFYSESRASQMQLEDAAINEITSYDGSASVHFPPIGDQGTSNSCVSWAYGYYQMTNNIANVRGLDAKNNTKYRISPAWIHNFLNP